MKVTMSNREKLLQMYNYAIEQEKCRNRKTFAELIGIMDKNLSNALSSNEKTADRFCTNGLLNKANAALGYVFAQQWLQDGTGEMMANNNNNNIGTPAPARTQEQEQEQEHRRLRPSYDEDDVEFLKHRIKELEYIVELQRYRIKELEKGNASARAN